MKSVAEIWDKLSPEERRYAQLALTMTGTSTPMSYGGNLIPLYKVPFMSLQKLRDSIADGWPGLWMDLRNKCDESLRRH